MYCIFEYDIFDPSYEELGIRSSKWVFEVPCSVESIIDFDEKEGRISCLKNLMEEKNTIVKLVFLRPLDDFVYVDNDLNIHFDLYQYHGKKKLNGVDFYIYSTILSKKDKEE